MVNMISCAWCGAESDRVIVGLPKDWYAVERSDGDKFFFCGAGHAIWWLSDEIEDEANDRLADHG
jgi:hypothetical protein